MTNCKIYAVSAKAGREATTLHPTLVCGRLPPLPRPSTLDCLAPRTAKHPRLPGARNQQAMGVAWRPGA